MNHKVSQALLGIRRIHLLASRLQVLGKKTSMPDDLVRRVLDLNFGGGLQSHCRFFPSMSATVRFIALRPTKDWSRF
jgi:hypothetical protein